MAGTIVVDRLESDASYASSINVASPMVVSNTLTMASSSRVSGDIIVGTTRSANTSARIEVSGTNVDAGLLVRQTSNTSYAGMRFYNATDTAFRALELDYSSPGYTGPLVSGGPTGESGSITTTGAYPLTLGTNNSARIIIDSSGRVTTPSQPAFKAYKSSSQTLSAGVSTNKVTLETTQINIGNHYSTSTSRFTAPVAGLYYFTGQIYLGSGADGYYGLSVFRNGSQENGYAYYRGGFGDISAHFSTIMNLNANDYVEMYAYPVAGLTAAAASATYFAGYLLG